MPGESLVHGAQASAPPKMKKPAMAAKSEKVARAKKPENKDNCGGHTTGSRNFNAEDMVRLVQIVGEVLPLGQT
jgi:hypothetical protein